MTLDSLWREALSGDDDARPWLCRTEDLQPFAYARGRDFFRRADHRCWAHLDDDQRLVSSRSGRAIAYRIGHVFYDSDTDAPIYYETTWSRLSPQHSVDLAPPRLLAS